MGKLYQIKALANNVVELMLYGDIGPYEGWGDQSARSLALELQSFSDSDIELRINSPGGFTTEAFAMYNVLKRHKGKVTATVDGLAASAATIVMMAAEKIVVPRNSMVMVHNPWSWVSGTSEDMRAAADSLDKVEQQMIDLYSERTGIPKEDVQKLCAAETYMTGDEAVEAGFADAVSDEDVKVYATSNHVVFGAQKFKMASLSGSLIAAAMKVAVAAEPEEVTPQNEEEDVEIKTIAELKELYPELCSKIEQEAAKAATEASASVRAEAVQSALNDERSRLQSIDEISQSIAPALVQEAKYKTFATAESLAFAAMKASKEQGKSFLRSREKDSEAVLETAVGTTESKESQQVSQAMAMVTRFKRKGA